MHYNRKSDHGARFQALTRNIKGFRFEIFIKKTHRIFWVSGKRLCYLRENAYQWQNTFILIKYLYVTTQYVYNYLFLLILSSNARYEAILWATGSILYLGYQFQLNISNQFWDTAVTAQNTINLNNGQWNRQTDDRVILWWFIFFLNHRTLKITPSLLTTLWKQV